MRRAAWAITAALMPALAPASALAQPTIHPSPMSPFPGEHVRVTGSAGGCAPGNQVTLLSAAFPATHEFAGVNAIFARVRANGHYRARVRIPLHRAPHHYRVSARCGGGNFGVASRLNVRQPRSGFCTLVLHDCYGVVNGGATPVRLRIRGKDHVLTEYHLCVRGRDAKLVCKRFHTERVGDGFRSVVRWDRHFPDLGRGTYRVTWRTADNASLGPPVVFNRG